jgi:hypothetical protein
LPNAGAQKAAQKIAATSGRETIFKITMPFLGHFFAMRMA